MTAGRASNNCDIARAVYHTGRLPRISKFCLSLKIISKCSELVKLCHINRSGPVFWDTLYVVTLMCYEVPCYIAGAFLIPYFLYLFVMGMPLVMLELAYGQFSSLSPIAVWKMAPLFEGTRLISVKYYVRERDTHCTVHHSCEKFNNCITISSNALSRNAKESGETSTPGIGSTPKLYSLLWGHPLPV